MNTLKTLSLAIGALVLGASAITASAADLARGSSNGARMHPPIGLIGEQALRVTPRLSDRLHSCHGNDRRRQACEKFLYIHQERRLRVAAPRPSSPAPTRTADRRKQQTRRRCSEAEFTARLRSPPIGTGL